MGLDGSLWLIDTQRVTEKCLRALMDVLREAQLGSLQCLEFVAPFSPWNDHMCRIIVENKQAVVENNYTMKWLSWRVHGFAKYSMRDALAVVTPTRFLRAQPKYEHGCAKLALVLTTRPESGAERSLDRDYLNCNL